MKPLSKEIADWIFETSARETSNQSWITYHDKICKEFGVSEGYVKANHESILEYLKENDDILDIEDGEDFFDLIISGEAVCARCDGAYCESCNVEH